MIYILDNNVIAELWKPVPDPNVLAWVLSNEWYIPAPVIAEIQEGAEALPSPARRMELNQKLDEMLEKFSAALLAWDAETARTWGRLKHSQEVKRKPQPLWDSLIDAMGVRYNAVIATRNQEDFRHAVTYDPWTGLEHPPTSSTAVT